MIFIFILLKFRKKYKNIFKNNNKISLTDYLYLLVPFVRVYALKMSNQSEKNSPFNL